MVSLDIRVKHPTTKLSWFDRLMVSWLLLVLAAAFVAGGFMWGSSWMSDTDYYASQVTAQ